MPRRGEFTGGLRQLSPSNGLVRMVFTRDASGRVAGMTRLINGEATTFPRIP